jgi:hypothetical protein
MTRPEYPLKVNINGRKLNRVIVDQHYREKHADSINDQLILELIKELDGRTFPIEEEHGEFQYFTVEPVAKGDKPYRLVLLICITNDYLGVINAFRVDRRPK